MTAIVVCLRLLLRIYLLGVLLLCLINPRTIHCSIIFWVNFGDVFAVSHFEEKLLYCHFDCSVLGICSML